MDPLSVFSVAAGVIQLIEEFRHRDAKGTELVESLRSLSGRVNDLTGQLESFGKQRSNEKWTDQGEGSREISCVALLRDLAEHSKSVLLDLANCFDCPRKGKGTVKAKALEWQGRLQKLQNQWESAVQQLLWGVPLDKRDSCLKKWREVLREPARALYEKSNNIISGEERQKPIAAVGMASRFPGQASSPNRFRQMLKEKQSISPIPCVRWELGPSERMSSEDLVQFDARFFTTNPMEASQIDPQQHLLFDRAGENIEDAGHGHDRSSETLGHRRDRYGRTVDCADTSRRCFDLRHPEETHKDTRQYHFFSMDQEEKQSVLRGDTLRTRQGPVSPVYHFLFSTASALTGVVCAICIGNYDRLHPRGHIFSPQRHTMVSPLPLWSSIILSPSPPVFVAATIIHGIATLSYYHSRPRDRYREWFLIAGTISGTIGGFWVRTDVQSVLSRFLPLMLLVSLVLCTGLNVLWDCCNCKRDRLGVVGGTEVTCSRMLLY